LRDRRRLCAAKIRFAHALLTCRIQIELEGSNEQPGLSVGSQDADSVQLNTCNRAAHSRTVSGCFHGVSFMNLRTHFPVMLGEYWVYVLAGIISITILMLLYSQ
jgi:hypothetical protein